MICSRDLIFTYTSISISDALYLTHTKFLRERLLESVNELVSGKEVIIESAEHIITVDKIFRNQITYSLSIRLKYNKSSPMVMSLQEFDIRKIKL